MAVFICWVVQITVFQIVINTMSLTGTLLLFNEFKHEKKWYTYLAYAYVLARAVIIFSNAIYNNISHSEIPAVTCIFFYLPPNLIIQKLDLPKCLSDLISLSHSCLLFSLFFFKPVLFFGCSPAICQWYKLEKKVIRVAL